MGNEEIIQSEIKRLRNVVSELQAELQQEQEYRKKGVTSLIDIARQIVDLPMSMKVDELVNDVIKIKAQLQVIQQKNS